MHKDISSENLQKKYQNLQFTSLYHLASRILSIINIPEW